MKFRFPLFYVIFCFFQISVYGQKPITLEDIYEKNVFQTKSVSDFRFLNDGVHYTRKDGNVIKKYNILDGSFVEDLMNMSTLENTGGFSGRIEDYTFSSNENKILITSEGEPVYRHSSKNKVFVYDRKSQKISAVFPEGKISNASFSPDESKVAFVYENNLYYTDLSSGKTIQITKDGQKNNIINGMCDWVYEEEFSFTQAYEWSKNGSFIAFLRFDESMVPEFTMDFYYDEMYPVRETFKYPKVGEKNAEVGVRVYDVKKKKVKDLSVSNEKDMYIPRIKWTQDDKNLVVYSLNRHQNHLSWYNFDVVSGNKSLLYEEKNKYYVDIHDYTFFLSDGKRFVTLSEKEGFNQIYLFDMSGKEIKKLTPGNYDVSEIYGVDEANQKIFFKASVKNPMESAIYSINPDGSYFTPLSDESGSHSAQFSSTFDIFVLHKSTINTPPVSSVFKRDKTLVRVLEKNGALTEKLSEYGVSPIEFFDFTTSEGVRLNGWMCKPKNFDSNKKYPVFMTQYSGPGSQSVVDRWQGTNYWWYQSIVQNGYIVICVDGRGTGNRGEEFKKMTYLKLGHYETLDQIEAAKYMASLPYVDGSRIGIYGWSYGGFMSSLCILKGNDVFKSAIAVAPVTSWKWYDSVYTERYMRTVSENQAGYAENSPVYFADKLKGNYLLIHGMADDNVHFQHAVEMANALIKHKKQFDTYFYPNRNHGIYGENARIHLFTKMTNFIYDKI
ncbi:MAG: S9 family peptidase [Saprospiraceae bacterium]|nr:S9 family peptidase [Saprospiraceae bacterium]